MSRPQQPHPSSVNAPRGGTLESTAAAALSSWPKHPTLSDASSTVGLSATIDGGRYASNVATPWAPDRSTTHLYAQLASAGASENGGSAAAWQVLTPRSRCPPSDQILGVLDGSQATLRNDVWRSRIEAPLSSPANTPAGVMNAMVNRPPAADSCIFAKDPAATVGEQTAGTGAGLPPGWHRLERGVNQVPSWATPQFAARNAAALEAVRAMLNGC